MIIVDRYNLLQTAFDEIQTIKNLRKTLVVEFYTEEAQDYGGPRREFVALILREIKIKYFDKGIRHHLENDYRTVGIIMALSVLQNGKILVLEEDTRKELFSTSEVISPCILKLREGLSTLGIYQLCKELPICVYLLQPNISNTLTFCMLKSLLMPSFSDAGSNANRHERLVYAAFIKYMREVAVGRRLSGKITLSDILKFATGAEEEPVLGFQIHPSVEFVEVYQGFLPVANTCIHCMILPRPTISDTLPEEDRLFNVYDFAFSNTYFGKD